MDTRRIGRERDSEAGEIPGLADRAVIAAMVFSENQKPDEVLSRFADGLLKNGLRLVGMIQRGHCGGSATRTLFATLLHSGDDVQLFQDLGAGAAGCKLDANKLIRAGASISDALIHDGGDILIINRFGKLEKEGKGLLFLIEQALSANIPVLIAVPEVSLNEWMEFSGGFGQRLECDQSALTAWWLSLTTPARVALQQRIA